MGTTKQLKRAARVILIGAPGVGKGTQAERLMARYPQLSAVSSGDLLRNSVRNKTPLGEPPSLTPNISSSSFPARDFKATLTLVQASKPKPP